MIVGAVKKSKPVIHDNPDEPRKSSTPKMTNEERVLDAVDRRDFEGAAAFIEFLKDELNTQISNDTKLWYAYSLFHLGKYDKAIQVYKDLLKEDPSATNLNLLLASCYFYMGEFETAREFADKGPKCDFKTRLIFHISQQLGNEEELLAAHSQLIGTLENQMSLAAIHYLRQNYKEAIEAYQKILTQHPDYLALHVYIAMCQFQLEDFDNSNESVDYYLSDNSDSAIALNVKSCDYLRLFDPDIAESQLLQIRKFSSASYDFMEHLVTHNLCVFHDGDEGYTVFPQLVNSIREARYNLAALYLRDCNPSEAMNLYQDVQPQDNKEALLRSNVLLAVGQEEQEAEPIDEAHQTFTEIGSMDEVRDTIPGRQALATSKFINGEYDETLRVLNTIEEYMAENDQYNYNKGMTLAMSSRWAEAETYFLRVKSEKMKSKLWYQNWLTRCLIKNGKAEDAWNVYAECTNSEDSRALLQTIANDCFQNANYYYAMKAYEILSQYEPDPSYKEGLIASSVGLFRSVLTRKEPQEKLHEVLMVLSKEPDAAEVFQAVQSYVESTYDDIPY